MRFSRWMTWSRCGSCRDPGIKFWIGAVACACLLTFAAEGPSADPLFGPQSPYVTEAHPYSVAIGDLNRDGHLDLVTANHESRNVSVLLGRGDGTFGPSQPYSTADTARCVAVGDLNGDGWLDLAVACEGGDSSTVAVLLGVGGGHFEAAQHFGVGGRPISIAIGDLDRDGRLDLVTANQGPANTVSVLLGNGNGTFQGKQDYAAGDYPHAVAIGDLNRDGRLDLAVACVGDHGVAVLLGRGDGAFEPRQLHGTGIYPLWVSIADLDGNGSLDLVAPDHIDEKVSVLLGNGNGDFIPGERSDVPLPLQVEVGDLNADGVPDVVASSESMSVCVLLGHGDGRFQPALHFDMPGTTLGIAIGDLNGDGAPDLAVTSPQGNSVSVLLNRSHLPALFGPRVDYPAAAFPYGIAVGDFSRDGRLDVAVANWGSAGVGTQLGETVSVLLGNGVGGLGPHSEFATGVGPRIVATDDFDRDGRLDLVVSNFGNPPPGPFPDSVSVLLGNGDGTFQPRADFETGVCPLGVATGDLNRDGCPDLLVANNQSLSISVLLGNGDGTFQPKVDYPTDSEPYSVAIADLDRDGRLDVVVANHRSASISVRLGHGDGTLGPALDCATADYPAALGIADFDRDGRLDVAVACSVSHTITVLLGSGDGRFHSRSDLEGGHDTGGLVIGDLNVDGRPDIAVVCNLDNKLLVFLGNGDGTFQPKMEFQTGAYPQEMSIGDLNRDGAPDLVVTNYQANTVSVFLNRSLTIPVTVENLEAVAGEGGVRLSWGLSAEVQRDLRGIRVERALTAEGPYAACTASPLEPANQMSFDDVETLGGGTYWYRLVLLLGNGSELVAGPVSIELGSGLPSRTVLHQPYEPAGGGPIQIHYSIATTRAPVGLAVYDVRGRVVWSLTSAIREPGEHSQIWDRRDTSGARVSRGVYLIRLEAGNARPSRKLVLVHR